MRNHSPKARYRTKAVSGEFCCFEPQKTTPPKGAARQTGGWGWLNHRDQDHRGHDAKQRGGKCHWINAVSIRPDCHLGTVSAGRPTRPDLKGCRGGAAKRQKWRAQKANVSKCLWMVRGNGDLGSVPESSRTNDLRRQTTLAATVEGKGLSGACRASAVGAKFMP
jgi:hypothetical protein